MKSSNRQNRFHVFGDPVELCVRSEQTGGAFSIGRQTCPPGGGPPPHFHHNEEEVFSVVSGRFEIFDGEAWSEIPKGGIALVQRGQIHCFRNSGETEGIIQFICGGNTFDSFLEGLAQFNMPRDVQAMVDYSAGFGIFFPALPPPTRSNAGE